MTGIEVTGIEVTGIKLEPPGRKALRPFAAGRTKRRDDGVDLAVSKGGVDTARTVDRVGGDPARVDPEGLLDGVWPLVEPARVMRFARHDPVLPKARLRRDIHHDALKIIDRSVLLAGRRASAFGVQRPKPVLTGGKCQSASSSDPLSASNIDPSGAELARRCVVPM